MLSDFLTSQYLQYKSDTDVVATWLANTAAQCGFDVGQGDDQGPSKKATKPSARLKGKARKAARGAQRKPDQVNDIGATAKEKKIYTIPIKQFTSLAEHIAGYDTPPVGPVAIPRHFTLALDRAISTRREFGKPGMVENADSIAQQNHGFFVGVLERVREILRPLMRTKRPETDALGPEEDGIRLANKFERLELQEPSEAFLNAPDAPKRAVPETVSEASAVKTEANYEAQVDPDREEIIFIYHLLIQDANAFIVLISQTWNGYKNGTVDLVSASITTNTAIDILRRMEDEMKPALDRFEGAERLLELFYIARCQILGEDPNSVERFGDGLNFKVYDQTQDLFVSAWQLLRAFTAVCDPRSPPTYKPGYYGIYDPKSRRATKSPREKFAEDKQILMEAFPEFCFLCFHIKGNPAEDELTRGLKLAFSKDERPFWLVFAVQVFLDINHILRDQVSRGLVDLQRSAMAMTNSIELNLQRHDKLRIENWPRQNDAILRQTQDDMRFWCETDPLQVAKKRLRRPPGEPFRLLQWHPLYCGILLYRFKVSYQEAGIAFAGAWGSVLYTLHLYNALRQEQLVNSRWADMEMLHTMQMDSLVGGTPKNPEEYLKRFALSMGYSARNFAKNRRNGRLQASKNGPKGLVEQAPVALMFKERFCDGSGKIDMTQADLQKILEKSEWTMEATTGNNLHDLMMQDVTPELVEEALPGANGSASLSALTLLLKLRLALQGEAVELAFDYFLMHRTCWRLLTAVKEASEDQLRNLFGVGCIEKECQLPFIVGYIFLAATNLDRLGNMAKKKADLVTSQLMVTAANVVKSMLASGMGSIVARVLRESHGIEFEVDSDSEGDSDAETIEKEVE